MEEENDERVDEEQEMDEMENHQRNHIGKKYFHGNKTNMDNLI